jgi:phage terminase large subunit
LSLTPKQEAARIILAGPATHAMLFGGSRSGKTFLLVRQVVQRALNAPGSRHAILRFRFNHIKASIILDTFPKVMAIAYPGVPYHLDKSDWYAELGDGSQIWFGGLDDKDRTEKILGQEHSTLYLNECSQIPLRFAGYGGHAPGPKGDDADQGAGA